MDLESEAHFGEPSQPRAKEEDPAEPMDAGDAGDGAAGAAEARDAGGAAPEDVSAEDISLVQNLIERCLQLYMPRDEVVAVLRAQAAVEPGFTRLVWGKLEEQNPAFFAAYRLRLKLRAQVVMFNHLLEQQVAVVQRVQRGAWGGGGGAPPGGGAVPLFQGGRPPPGGAGGAGYLLDPAGPSPLFPPLPHVGSEGDLAGLLARGGPGGGGGGGALPRVFSLSDLGLGAGADGGDGGGGEARRAASPSALPRNFSMSELRDAR
jgi:uncharacterized protein (TIGR01589 family)